jgi:hypothetical protein
MDGKRMKMIAELYGIVVKEYLKNSADYENIAKSNDSVYILQSGFTILTNVFKCQSINANAFESIYKTCNEAILMYLVYVDQIIALNKFTFSETTNANIFIFNKLIKRSTLGTDEDAGVRSFISNMSRLCGLIFDWTNPKYTLEDRNAIAETLLSGYIELFASMDKFGVIISSLELLREKYGALDLPKFQVYLKELYYVFRKNEVTKDRFEIYAMICSESCENQYRELLLTEDKLVFRKFFINIFS